MYVRQLPRIFSPGLLFLSTLSEHCCSGTTGSGALGGCDEKGPLAPLYYFQFVESYILLFQWNTSLRYFGKQMTEWMCDTHLVKALAIQ